MTDGDEPTHPTVALEIRWCFHGTAIVEDYEAALDWLARFCGCRPLEFSDEPDDPMIARRGGMTWIGDASIELIEPTAPDGAPARYLDRFGPGMYALAVQVHSLPAAIAELAAQGFAVVGRVEQGFVFSNPRQTAGLLLEWSENEAPDIDPRFGREMPDPIDPLIDVRRVAWFGALVDDIDVAVSALAKCGLGEVVSRDPSAPDDKPSAVLSLRDNCLALFRRPDDPDLCRTVWGSSVSKPRTHAVALRVRDLAATVQLLLDHGVRVVRGRPADGEVLTDPVDTVGIPIVWTDRDLDGDPRGPLQG